MIEGVYHDEDAFLYHVSSETTSEVYDVSMNEYGLLRCTCMDFLFRKLKGREGILITDTVDYCKHIQGVMLWLKKLLV